MIKILRKSKRRKLLKELTHNLQKLQEETLSLMKGKRDYIVGVRQQNDLIIEHIRGLDSLNIIEAHYKKMRLNDSLIENALEDIKELDIKYQKNSEELNDLLNELESLT